MLVKLEYDRSVSPTGLKIVQVPSFTNWGGSSAIRDAFAQFIG